MIHKRKTILTCCLMLLSGRLIYGIPVTNADIPPNSIAVENTVSDISSESDFTSYPIFPTYFKNGWQHVAAGWRYKLQHSYAKNSWISENRNLYYLDAEGLMVTGIQSINNKTYYFAQDGSLCMDGFYDIEGQTYLLDSDGSLCTGYQLFEGNRYFLYDNGVLLKSGTTPDGIYNTDENGKIIGVNLAELVSDCPLKDAPGTSGYTIGGYPLELFMISMAGETSGAKIIIGDKGRAYGLCQFDYRYDLTDFINYAYETHPALWFAFEPFVNKYNRGDPELIYNQEILQAFQIAEQLSPVNYASDQAEFLFRRYFSNTYQALEQAGFCLNQRNISVSAALMSININCGSQTGLYLATLSPTMTDEEMIERIYALRNSVLTRNGKGTNTRFLTSEPRLAQLMSTGSIRVDSEFSMAGGVEWDESVLKYCGEYLSDEEIQARYDELGISPFSIAAQTDINPEISDNESIATPSDAIPSSDFQIAGSINPAQS